MTGSLGPTSAASEHTPHDISDAHEGQRDGAQQHSDSRGAEARQNSISAWQEGRKRSTDSSVRRRGRYEEDDRVATEMPELPEGSHHDAGGDGEWLRDERRYSDVTTADDSVNTERYRLCRQTPNWYDGFMRFWHREVSVKVDAGYRRDHLGMPMPLVLSL